MGTCGADWPRTGWTSWKPGGWSCCATVAGPFIADRRAEEPCSDPRARNHHRHLYDMAFEPAILEADLGRRSRRVDADPRVHMRHRGACAEKTPFRWARAVAYIMGGVLVPRCCARPLEPPGGRLADGHAPVNGTGLGRLEHCELETTIPKRHRSRDVVHLDCVDRRVEESSEASRLPSCSTTCLK